MKPRRAAAIARRCGVACAAAVLTFAGLASAKLVKYGLATVDLRATGPGGTVVQATTHDVRVADDGRTLALTAGLASLATGDGLADD